MNFTQANLDVIAKSFARPTRPFWRIELEFVKKQDGVRILKFLETLKGTLNFVGRIGKFGATDIICIAMKPTCF